MIRLVFTINREIFKIEIREKEIWYFDRIWKKQIRLIPKDEEFIKKIRLSRNKIPSNFTDLFNLTAEEQKEWEGAKTEEDLAEICIKDIRKKGAKLLKREKE